MSTQAAESYAISATVNGVHIERDVPSRMMLAEFLRSELGLTGTKVSCDMQVCGACSVLVDGRPVSSCTYLAIDIDRKSVETIEGLSADGTLDPLQNSFIDNSALQCGFCTAGFIMMSRALLRSNPNPTREDVISHLEGNICRCTGYEPIVNAVLDAAQRQRGGQETNG